MPRADCSSNTIRDSISRVAPSSASSPPAWRLQKVMPRVRRTQSPCLPLACRPSAHADTSPETAGDAHPRAETEMSEEQEVFKFAVTAGLKPGDVVRARTPAGIRVEVTIPPDALPGDVVQFVLPSAAGGSDVGGAGGTTLEEKVDGPTLMAKIKSEEKINVRDVNQAGVSNAAPKITFSVTVPLDTKAGQTLVAELPDGQRVVVTVPGSAKPGRDLFFRVPAGGPEGPQPVHVSMKCATGPAQPTPRRKAGGVTQV